MSGRLEGRVAFITGAARGQGRNHAVRLAEEGADIIACDFNVPVKSVPYPLATPEDLAETARLVEALDRRVVTFDADVRDYDALASALDASVAALGRLDIVSANAGIYSTGRAVDLSEDAWQDMIDINLTGVWHTAKAAIPHIVAGGRGGSIVVTSSTAGIRGVRGLAHYVAAKHGIIGLTRTLALELAEHKIRVNAVAPSNVDTAMINHDEIYSLFVPGIPSPTREDFMAVAKTMNILEVPWVEVRDVSEALLFLVSDEARYITGVTLPVDAGSAVR